MWPTGNQFSGDRPSIHPTLATLRWSEDEGQRARSTGSLAQLDRHLLRDIGVEPDKTQAPQPKTSTPDGTGRDAAPAAPRRGTAAGPQGRSPRRWSSALEAGRKWLGFAPVRRRS